MRAEVCWSELLGGGCLGVLEIALEPPPSSHLLPCSDDALKLRGMGLLHAAVPALLSAVAEVEKGGVGGDTGKVTGFGSFPAFEAHMREAVAKLPAVLEEELRAQMHKLDPHQLVAEIRGYLCPSNELRTLMGGVLALLGHKVRARLGLGFGLLALTLTLTL